MSKRFVRQESHRHSRLGKKRKKLQVWRKPKGRDSKIRLKVRGRPESPTVGHKSPRKELHKIKGHSVVLIHNMRELFSLREGSSALLARIGARKKIEIIEEAKKKKITILNVEGAK